MWIETATEGGQRFMVAWRKEGVNAVRHRQKIKAKETWKGVIVRGSIEPGKRNQLV